MHMRHKPPIGKGAPTMERHAHRGGCCAGRPIPKSAKSEPLSGFVFFADAPISSECGISRGQPLRGGTFLYFAFWQSLFPAVLGVGAPSQPAPCAPFWPLRIFKEAEPCRRNFACIMALSLEVRFPLGREWKYWRGQSLARGVSAVCARGVLRPLCRIARFGE